MPTSSPTSSVLDAIVLSPLAAIGRGALEGAAYLGSMATLATSAARSVLFRREAFPPLLPAVSRQMTAMLAMGIPLVALVHVGMGSFLSMQAYFGGTFVDGTGAVVGVGLIRNIAPLMTGLTLAGLLGARTTAELRNRGRFPVDVDPNQVADRGAPGAARASAPPPRLTAARVLAAVVVGLVLTIWAVAVGTVVGWQVAQTLLGVSTHAFFYMLTEMIWMRDVVGLGVKGVLYGGLAALLACHEGLRGPDEGGEALVPAAACRATCLAAVAILAINSGWFLLVYHAGAAFGPTLLAPPSQ